MNQALLLLRTPLQAKLAKFSLGFEGITDYDVVFFTHHKAPKTLLHFEELAAGANHAKLIFVPPWLPSEVANICFYLLGLRQIRKWGRDWDVTMFGSLDAPAVTSLAAKFGAQLVTVDDGTANVNPSGSYFIDRVSSNHRIIRRIMNSPNMTQVKSLVKRHYTVFPEYRHAIERTKLVTIAGWPEARASHLGGAPFVVYVGTAESLWMSSCQVKMIRDYLELQEIDSYIAHPMESEKLVKGVPELPNPELLAEDALSRVPSDLQIHLIGAFSTVMLTTEKIASRRTMLIPHGLEQLIPLAKQSGCEVVKLPL